MPQYLFLESLIGNVYRVIKHTGRGQRAAAFAALWPVIEPRSGYAVPGSATITFYYQIVLLHRRYTSYMQSS